MKKVIIAALFIGGALSFTSCKKEYSCCYPEYDFAGVTVPATCTTTGKISKKDAEALETAGSQGGVTYTCTAK